MGRNRDQYEQVNSLTIRRKSVRTNVYVTFGEDENGDLLEIFITQGKAGTDEAAYAEALGRAISVALQTVDPGELRGFLQRVTRSLLGIQSVSQAFIGEKGKVLSIPDAIAKTFAYYYELKYKCSVYDDLLERESA